MFALLDFQDNKFSLRAEDSSKEEQFVGLFSTQSRSSLAHTTTSCRLDILGSQCCLSPVLLSAPCIQS